jgi:hypothetical protein
MNKKNGSGSWVEFKTAEEGYIAKWGSNKWNALDPEEQKKERDKVRQEYYLQHVHHLKPNEKVHRQTALCLSGGGIRSAAFALGYCRG